MNSTTDINAEESAAVSVIKCVIGAVLGSIPSMILMVVLGKVGYLASICGFFMIFGQMYACDFFTRKSTQINVETALVICVIVMAAAVYVCERMIWAWELKDAEASGVASFSYCFLNFGRLAEQLDIEYEFLSALIKSYVFAAIGAVAGYFKFAKK